MLSQHSVIKHSLFSSGSRAQQQEQALAALIFTQALKDLSSAISHAPLTPKQVAAFIRQVAEHYSTDELFKALLVKNKQSFLLQHSLYETAAALGDETASQHLKALREDKDYSESLFINLRNRAQQQSFTAFLKHLNLSSATGETAADEPFLEYLRETGQLGKESIPELRLKLVDLSKSYAESRIIRHLTRNYPAYRSWIKTQVDTQNALTERNKISLQGPANYLMDFLDNHRLEMETELPDKDDSSTLGTHLLLTLGKIAASKDVGLEDRAGEIFIKAAEKLAEAQQASQAKTGLTVC